MVWVEAGPCRGLDWMMRDRGYPPGAGQLVKAPVPFLSAAQEAADAMTDSLARM